MVSSIRYKWLARLAGAVSMFSIVQADPIQAGTNDALCVTTAIQGALEKNPTFSDHAHHIQVITTDSHEVYLIGSVSSEDERKKVIAVANDFTGDNQIKDQLTVAK